MLTSFNLSLYKAKQAYVLYKTIYEYHIVAALECEITCTQAVII